MSVNSSSFDDPSLLPHNLSSSNSSFPPLVNTCFRSKMSISVFSTFSIINLLLLPLLLFVLYLGYQQWRKQRSVSTAATTHSDLFTYHSIAMQLIEFLGFVLFFCGGYINLPGMMFVGSCFWSITSLGQSLFHLLTCVERYLAVVHPITYLSLRQAGGVKIRNISIGCVWLLSFGWIAVLYVTSSKFNLISYICTMVCFLIVICFCSISVLQALKRPGPGEVGGNSERVDKSKERAFHIIMAIIVALLFRFGGNLIGSVINSSVVLSTSDMCVVLLSAFWFDLPSSLVLPLLFLQRAGKLQNCKLNSEAG